MMCTVKECERLKGVHVGLGIISFLYEGIGFFAVNISFPEHIIKTIAGRKSIPYHHMPKLLQSIPSSRTT